MFEPSSDFLELVRCPATQSRLICLPAAVVAEINKKIQAGDVYNQIGQRVESELEAALLNEGHTLVVPVREGSVTLLVDELIPTEPLSLSLPSNLRTTP